MASSNKESEKNALKIHVFGEKSKPFTKRCVVQEALPASLATRQEYSPLCNGSTSNNSSSVTKSSREMLHDSPDTSSLLPLNHLTLKGGVPLMTLVNVRLIPGRTSKESGVCSKDGGSRYPRSGGDQEKKEIQLSSAFAP